MNIIPHNNSKIHMMDSYSKTKTHSCNKWVGVISCALASTFFTACATLDLRATPPVFSTNASSYIQSTEAFSENRENTIKVMTLNIAHARNDGFHQLFQNGSMAKDNLDSIQSLFLAHKPNIVALQEADRPSFWSGGIDHVEYLSRKTPYTYFVNGEHAKGFNLSYGTALLSDLKLNQPLAVTFMPEHSITPKGFLISTIQLSNTKEKIDVVSVHLEIFSQTVRQKQAVDLVKELRKRNRPLIIMGDFNTEWHQTDAVLKYISHELKLHTYEPGNRELTTFPFLKKRYDWILASPHFTFTSYKVLAEKVSDHQAVAATLKLNTIKSLLPDIKKR